MTVYADVLFFVNLTVDTLLLRLGAKLCGAPLSVRRALLAGSFGGAYAVLQVLPVPAFFRSGWMHAFAFALMGAIAFGWRKRALRPAAVTLLCSSALAGTLLLAVRIFSLELVLFRGMAVYPLTAKVLILLAGAFYLAGAVFAAGALRHFSRELVPLRLGFGGKEISVSALRDTGNTLCDPMTGKPVIVLEWDRGEELTGASLPRDPVRAVETLRERCPWGTYRLIPFGAVGTVSGLLAAFSCEAANGRKTEKKILVALSPTPVSDGGSYEALIGGDTL